MLHFYLSQNFNFFCFKSISYIIKFNTQKSVDVSATVVMVVDYMVFVYKFFTSNSVVI